MRPRRVLMTADAVGGVWTYAVDLASALAAADIQVILAVDGPPPTDDQRRAAGQIEGLSLIETGSPLDWMADDPAAVRGAADALRRLAGELRPDVIHLNSPALAAGAPFEAPVLGVCHSCLATWWSAVKTGPMPEDFRWRTQLLGEGLRACDALAAPSRSFSAAVAETYGLPAPAVIHNGRRPPPATEPARRDALVFTAGRLWDEGKNIAVLDAAAEFTETAVFAAGPLQPPGGGRAVSLCAARSLGTLSAGEVAGWLARAPIFASSALYEPFGLGVLEAAQAGCALVLSDIPTFRELWDGAALFADPREPAAFATHIDALIGDPAEAERLGGLAQARAARFTLESAAARTLDLYRQLGRAREAA